jgi:hypothetical protein
VKDASYDSTMVNWLKELGWRLEASRWNLRIAYRPIWKGLKKGLFLFCYWAWWFVILFGAMALAIGAITITWNVGPSRLFGWNSLAYHETMAIMAFAWTVRLTWLGYRALRRKFG